MDNDPLFPGYPMYKHIRSWEQDKFRLVLWDTGEHCRPGPQRKLAYQLWDRGKIIFAGNDFGCSPLIGSNSDKCVASLLSFLSLQPGDTDKEYFEDYTPNQLAWCKSGRAEDLSYLAHELEQEDQPLE